MLFEHFIYDIYNFFLLTDRPIFPAAQLYNSHKILKAPEKLIANRNWGALVTLLRAVCGYRRTQQR
jgi:hypothetical protein